jgi:predicted molibdopterin-dependent oxidoreductase YjgC
MSYEICFFSNVSVLTRSGLSQTSPRVMNTYEVIEHYQSGTVTRNCPRLVEASPEAFVMISLLPVQSNTAIMQAGSALLISK